LGGVTVFGFGLGGGLEERGSTRTKPVNCTMIY
jgi:hypothetical protein